MSAETFNARCCGDLTLTDGADLLKHRRSDAHEGNAVPVLPGGDTYRRGLTPVLSNPVVKVFVKPKVTLTKTEKEWLGRYVTIGNAREVWQVWAMHPQAGYVWLVRDGKATMRHTAHLVIRASASGYEDVAFNFESEDVA